MAQCPVCAGAIPDDFGLIECPSCNAQLLVHMDGRVEYSSGEQPPVAEPPEGPRPDPKSKPEEVFELGDGNRELEFDFKTPTPSLEPVDPQPSPQTLVAEEPPLVDIADAPAEEFAAEEPAAENPPPDAADESAPAPVPGEFVDDLVPDDQPPGEVYGANPPVPRPSPDSPDLSDIARFGNSDASTSRDGSLRYNLHIRGIDTSDIRDAFREAITDRKLVWDIEQILRSMRNGEVHITNIPAPKAFIVISRLRNLPVQIDWEQYAITQT